MANFSPEPRIAIPAAAILLLALAALLLWPQKVDPPLDTAIESPTPPLAAAPRWPLTDDAPTLHWEVGTTALLRLPDGQTLAPTPAPTPHHWDVHHLDVEGWTALAARADNGDHATWWFTESSPYAILDLQADLSRGDWSIELPDLPIRAYPADLLASINAAEEMDDVPLVALTLQSPTGPLSLAFDGPAVASLDTSTSPVRLRLNALPRDCESLLSAPSRIRLILHYGDAPLPLAAAGPADASSQLIPIFAEPTNRGGDPWEEGRSRDAHELARRIRALIFGHSNTDDPRYGNGGLLQQNIGASFVIPMAWWTSPAITALREDLEQTPYELILATETPELAPSGPNLHTDAPLECATLAERSFVTSAPTTDAPTYHLGSWLPQTPQLKAIAPTRETILDHLLPEQGTTGGLRPGRLTLTYLPLIASRNPLVDSFENTLLVPERQGHWTLHEDLARALVTFEFREDRPTLAINSLATRAVSQRLEDRLALWQPDGTLSDATSLLLTPGATRQPTSSELTPPTSLRWQVSLQR
ncbi:hypothetical protein EA187_15145 [Lujinxingia sediminis]|uniref:Uncharacterized protein n=1 Tax=Lujinxingia sediminis TaxID=2480984 RepID=A0ABY0CQB1_9DELT|nr:hypothetical protein [Lujinxingia sediminis]RVU42529.1 hypothetical protein EA187_15145 [Lujinxingia sediminis]